MKTKDLRLLIATAGLLASGTALAAGGVDVASKFQQILDAMKPVSVVLATIALLWAGYKIFFKGANLGDVSGPILGGIVVGAAPWIAELLVQGTL